jgi:hypothetical protein
MVELEIALYKSFPVTLAYMKIEFSKAKHDATMMTPTINHQSWSCNLAVLTVEYPTTMIVSNDVNMTKG